MKGTGIQLGGDYDLSIKVIRDATGKITGGWQTGETTAQNQALILICQKGELKEQPTVGIGLNDICNDDDFRLWKREITEQIERDGQQITELILDEKGLKLEAKYR
jgi:hypothetical protein